MARLVRRPRYEALARTLADENVEATPRQIERWDQAKWGAPDLMAPPEVLAAHYGDLIRLVRPGRPPAEVPLEMATLRHFTPGLPAAIHDLTAECAPDWKLSSDADLDTGRLMDQAADYPLLRRFVERFQRGSEKSGDPRPGTLSPGRLEANPLDKDKAAKARIKDRSQERTYGVVADMMDALARPATSTRFLTLTTCTQSSVAPSTKSRSTSATCSRDGACWQSERTLRSRGQRVAHDPRRRRASSRGDAPAR